MDIDFVNIIASVLALMIAIIGHEIMHGWVAHHFGDDTAKDAGRLTVNPIKHVDPIGTILVPGMLFLAQVPFLFGWAKPVPINMRTVLNRGGYAAAMQVTLAGIAYNLLLAVIASVILLSMPAPAAEDSFAYVLLYALLFKTVLFNVILAIFNLWPIPQFDGAHFLSFLTLRMGIKQVALFYQRIEPYGIFIVLLILAIPQLRQLLFMPAIWLLNTLLT